MKKRLMITGVSGFLGHHICKEAQKRGWFVVGVDKRPIGSNHCLPDHFIQADVFDLTFRDLMNIDAVAHLAWRTNIPDCVRHPEESTRQNIDMTVHILEVAKEASIKKLFFPSTASIYSDNPTPWTEDMPSHPIEPYSWQKLSCEQLCKMYSEQYGVPTVVLRFFQVYGELQRDDTALAAFIRSKKENKPVKLTRTMAQSSFDSGQRDFVYAGDLAEAVMMAIEGDVCKGEMINIASGKVRTMKEIADALEAEVEWIPRRPYEVERHEGNINKARVLLGWKAKTDVIEWLKGKKYENT